MRFNHSRCFCVEILCVLVFCMSTFAPGNASAADSELVGLLALVTDEEVAPAD